MKIKIFVIGKVQKKYFKEAIHDFVERLKHYSPVDIIFIKEEKITPNKSAKEILRIETRRIRQKLTETEVTFLVVLDKAGQQFSSEQLAGFLVTRMNANTKTLGFVIGGPLGLDQEIVQEADLRLSLSLMTFLHEQSLLIIIEQLYRAYTIINGEKYHK